MAVPPPSLAPRASAIASAVAPPLDDVLAHRDRDRGVAVGRADEPDDAAAHRLHRLDARAGRSSLRSEAVEARDEDAVLGLRRELARRVGGLLRLQPVELVLQRADLIGEPLDLVGHLLRRRPEELARAAQQLLLELDVLERAVAGHRFDAAQVRADGTFAHDLDRTDEPRARATCVPPHSSVDGPASSTRTISPYFSPKNAIAPMRSASAFVVS